MKNTIPTAEEFMYQNDILNSNRKITKAMIEFAKLHVAEALKEASEKAEINYDYSGNTGSEYCTEYVNKVSILNSYSLENIK